MASSCSSGPPSDKVAASTTTTAAVVAARASKDLFDQDSLHTFELVLSETALAQIDADPSAEEYVEGSLIFEGETLTPVGIRYKGSIGAFVNCLEGPNLLEPSGAKTCTKLSMKVKIDWDDPDAEFHGVRKLQFHSQNLDPSQMHERLGYWLYREMGVPAPRSVHARLMINGEYIGLFALTEQIDGRFTRENFDDGTGNLYKEVWPFDSDGRPSASSALLDGLKTNEDEAPTTALVEGFAADLMATEPGQRRAVVEEWMDVDSLIAHLAVDRAIRNDDGPFHWYCDRGECSNHNYYLYEDPTAELLHLIPWDLDNAFENIQSDTNPVTPIGDTWNGKTNECEPYSYGLFRFEQRSAVCDPLFAAWAEFEAEYEQALAALVSGPLSSETIDPLLAKWEAQITESTAQAAEAHDDAVSGAQFADEVQQLRSDLAFIRDRSNS